MLLQLTNSVITFFYFSEHKTKYWIAMDKQKFEETDSFIEALQMLLCLYFIFNRTYPKTNVCMLLFIEMYLCNIISEKGTRALQTDKSKVLTVYRNLSKLKVDC